MWKLCILVLTAMYTYTQLKLAVENYQCRNLLTERLKSLLQRNTA
jgi:hypothetical protein